MAPLGIGDGPIPGANAQALLGAVCRSPVVRDRFKGDNIQRVPAAEGVGRILGQLGQLLVAVRVIGVPDREVWPLLTQISLDGMHPLRRRVVELAVATKGQMTTTTYSARLDLPHTSIRRHLEDLHARGVLARVAYTGPEAWVASEWSRARWGAVVGPQGKRST